MLVNFMTNIESKIISIIDDIKPFLIMDGGNVDFIKYEDNIVYIKVLGACQNCGMLDVTIKDLIEATIIEEIPDVKEVRNI